MVSVYAVHLNLTCTPYVASVHKENDYQGDTELSVDVYAMLLLSSADMISVPPLVRGRGGIYFDNNV